MTGGVIAAYIIKAYLWWEGGGKKGSGGRGNDLDQALKKISPLQ